MNKKLKKLIDKMEMSRLIFRQFGIKYGFNEFLGSCLLRDKGSIGKKFHKYQYGCIKRKLIEDGYLSNKHFFDAPMDLKLISESDTIWVLWWQGIDLAPEIVKACINSIIKNKKKHNVVILSENNIRDYVDLPENIYEKLEMGEITVTHFSDILRTKILYDHGGIWMDATLYMIKEFDEDLYKYSFYTINHGKRADYHICKGKWTGFFMAAGKGNPILGYLSTCLLEYWRRETVLLCYLLIDCFFAIGYENIVEMNDMVNRIGINNSEVLTLAEHFNEKYSKEYFEYLAKDTYLHKLSYKFSVEKKEDSIYQYFLNA